MKRLIILCIFLHLSIMLIMGRDYDKRLNVAFDQKIDIKNISGEVKIRGWDNDEVRVKGSIGSNVDRIIFEMYGNKLVIKPEIDQLFLKSGKGISCELRIYVPVNSPVKVDLVSSPVEIVNLDSTLSVTSVSGDISIKSLAESIDLQTISGEIKVDGSSRRLTGSSISGDFTVEGDFPSIKLKSTSGDIKYEGGLLKNASIYSTSGDVKIECKDLDSSHIEIGTVSGDVRLRIPRKAPVTIDLKSISGEIRADVDNYDEVSRDERRVSLKRGGSSGSSSAYIETISGDISIPE